jgi:hypothetical protein
MQLRGSWMRGSSHCSTSAERAHESMAVRYAHVS